MLSKKWMTVIGATVITGVLATGVAFAAGTDTVEKAVGKVSPGMQELLKEIKTLRHDRMEQLKNEINGLIDKAQADGKITPDEATKLKERGKGQFKGHGGFKDRGGFKGHRGFGFMKGATEEQVKARLDEAVKNGRLTQEQADKLLKKWQDWKAKQGSSETKS
jgi:polyhydroxyalkanoate synthesis regulator phasin